MKDRDDHIAVANDLGRPARELYCCGAVEIAVNGGFERGDFTGWTNFCDNGAASCTISTDNPNGGTFAARLEQPTPAQNVVIKQERIAAGEVATGDTVDVSFFLRGAVGVGGVVFLEVFTEETGGNVVQEGIVGFTPTNDWVEISETFTITGNPGDGITVQIAGVTGGDAASFVDANTVEVQGKDGKQTLKADDVVVATGSVPIEIPDAKSFATTTRGRIRPPREPLPAR